jgi:magnesium-transporting ATPase (P-type)
MSSHAPCSLNGLNTHVGLHAFLFARLSGPSLRNTHAMQLFSQMMADSATVIRGGNKLVLDPVSLVPGDIVWVQSGDRVAADMRVVRLEYMLAVSGNNGVELARSSGCVSPVLTMRFRQLDQSFSTGRTQTMYISDKTFDSAPRVRSVLLAGDFVMEGSAICVVTATGSNTYISKLIQTKQWPPRPNQLDELLEDA